jgi:hypothetical protein
MLHWRSKTLPLAMTLAMALSVLATRSVARSYVFPVHSTGADATGQDVLVELTFARDGTPVRALELRAPSASRTIVSFHNNRDTAETNIDVGRTLRNRGFDRDGQSH